MANKKITDFPQVYSDYPCKDCITLPICLNKSEVDVAKCPYVRNFFYSEINSDRLQFVVHLSQFPIYQFLIGFTTSRFEGDEVHIVARNSETNNNIIIE